MAIRRNNDIPAARRRPEDHCPALAANPRAAARKRGDDLHAIAVLGKWRPDLRCWYRHSGNFVHGAANLAEDTGYAARVLAEHDLLKAVASGRTVPATINVRPLREAASAPATGGDSAQIALLR